MKDFFNSRAKLKVGNREYVYYRLDALEKAGLVFRLTQRFPG